MRLGEKNLKSEGEPLKHEDKMINKVVIHEHFHNLTKENDIALLQMEGPKVTFKVTGKFDLINPVKRIPTSSPT